MLKDVTIASAGFAKLVDELTSCNHENSSENDEVPPATKCDMPNLNNEVQATFAAQLSDSIDPSSMRNSMTADTLEEIFSPPLDIYAGGATIHAQKSVPDIYNPQEQLAFPLELTGNTELRAGTYRKSFSPPFHVYYQSATIGQTQSLPDPRLSLPFLPLAADEEKWDVSNDAFLRALSSTVFVSEPDQVDPDVPFKAVFGGWHTVDAREREKPIWNMLRLIDERVFGMWTSKIQKVALMYVTHALVKVRSYGKYGQMTFAKDEQFRMNPIPQNLENIPTWLRSRPSQDGVIHPPVIDLLLW